VGRALAVAVLIGTLSSTAMAQSPRAGGPSPLGEQPAKIGAEIAIGGNLARGFVDREMITARGVFEAWSGKWGLYLQPYWLYGRVGTPIGKLTTDNEIYERTGLFRTLAGPWFAYAVNAYDRSLRRKIAHRDLLGAGAGIRLWQCGPSSLLTSVGALYEVADYKDGSNDSPIIGDGTIARGLREVGRWSVRVYGRYRLAGGKINITHDVIVIPSFRDPAHDYRILMFGAIEAPLAKGFSVRIQADATREGDAIIVAGTKNDDLAVSFGLAYKAEWSRKPAAPPPPP
jgi:hypothetical protein